jgi:hypothetical protein
VAGLDLGNPELVVVVPVFLIKITQAPRALSPAVVASPKAVMVAGVVAVVVA